MRRVRQSEEGFGLVELLIAMTVLAVAVMALVAGFSSGYVALNSASRGSTAAAVADIEMEKYRSLEYSQIATMTPTTTSKTGPDGRTYGVTTEITTQTPTGGRIVKVVKISVSYSSKTYAKVESTFDQCTGVASSATTC